MSLTDYAKKRNFKNTPEPGNKLQPSNKNLSFVIQRHDASHLHYDFRLELDGVLKSWAIPKGPSLNPSDKRLAVMVEDHPLSYGKFEGVIPAGNYGAGTVEIWDKGTYISENSKSTDSSLEIRKGLKEGSLKFIINGEKLKGSFALVRLKDGKDKNWLLIKHRDEYAVADFKIEDDHTVKTTTAINIKGFRSVRSKGRKISDSIKPMLAATGDKPFDDPDWIYEIKWDGYRAIAEIKKDDIKLYSRNGLSFSELYPEITTALKTIKDDAVLDGEIVVLDAEGKPSFQKLQHLEKNRTHPLLYYVFDCLSYKGKDITNLPLLERKSIAQKLIPQSDVIRYSDHVVEGGKEFYSEIVKVGGLEGMIAKHAKSTYTQGKRSDRWLKIKNLNTQEAIIAGYTEPRASRKYFGALVLGMFDKGKLKYIGHTGTGFTDKILKELHGVLQPLIIKSSPFSKKIVVNAPVTWVEPTLVCNVKFTELTEEGSMRHPVFLGLRVDKAAAEVDHLDKKLSTKKSISKSISTSAGKKEKPAAATEEIKTTDKFIKVQGHEVKLTNLHKVFWPDEGYTKGDVINYYNRVAPFILPYLKDRPQSLKRNPNGIIDKGFFHKDAGDKAPEWVESVKMHSESTHKDIDYILCNDKATLLYLNNLGCIEINPFNSRVKKPDHPDYLIMDIDPSDKNSFEQVVDVALVIKEILDKAGATCYCKTSGATGLHIYIPLQAAYTYDQARPFAELIAVLAVQQVPSFTTIERQLNKRWGRIYVDYLQNRRGQTLASAYSLRPVPGASISTPLAWKEVRHGLQPLDFNITNIHKRLEKTGDLFAGVLKDKNNLEKCLKALDG